MTEINDIIKKMNTKTKVIEFQNGSQESNILVIIKKVLDNTETR